MSRYLLFLLLFISSYAFAQGEDGWPDLPPIENGRLSVFNPTSFLIVAGAAGASYFIAEKLFDDQNINYYQARIGYYGAQRSTSIILQNFGIEKTVSPWFTIGLEFNSQQWIEGSGSRGNGVGLIGYYRWSLFGKKKWSPYIEYGTGVFQGFKKFPENSSNFTFNLTTNVGLEYTFKNQNKFRAHYGHIHQSNSSLFENNIGIDGNGFGFSYVWHWADGN